VPLHPRVVHFPIALLVVGMLLVVASLHPRARHFQGWGWLNVALGWMALFPAIFTGLIAQSVANMGPAVANVVNWHISAALGTLVVFGYVLYERLRHPDGVQGEARWRILVGFAVGLGLLVMTGELGGRLVYWYGVGVR